MFSTLEATCQKVMKSHPGLCERIDQAELRSFVEVTNKSKGVDLDKIAVVSHFIDDSTVVVWAQNSSVNQLSRGYLVFLPWHQD